MNTKETILETLQGPIQFYEHVVSTIKENPIFLKRNLFQHFPHYSSYRKIKSFKSSSRLECQIKFPNIDKLPMAGGISVLVVTSFENGTNIPYRVQDITFSELVIAHEGVLNVSLKIQDVVSNELLNISPISNIFFIIASCEESDFAETNRHRSVTVLDKLYKSISDYSIIEAIKVRIRCKICLIDITKIIAGHKKIYGLQFSKQYSKLGHFGYPGRILQPQSFQLKHVLVGLVQTVTILDPDLDSIDITSTFSWKPRIPLQATTSSNVQPLEETGLSINQIFSEHNSDSTQTTSSQSLETIIQHKFFDIPNQASSSNLIFHFLATTLDSSNHATNTTNNTVNASINMFEEEQHVHQITPPNNINTNNTNNTTNNYHETFENITNTTPTIRQHVIHDKQDFIICPFCNFLTNTMISHIPICFDPKKRSFLPNTKANIKLFIQHLDSFHDHFAYELVITSNFDIHLVFQRKLLLTENKNIQKRFHNQFLNKCLVPVDQNKPKKSTTSVIPKTTTSTGAITIPNTIDGAEEIEENTDFYLISKKTPIIREVYFIDKPTAKEMMASTSTSSSSTQHGTNNNNQTNKSNNKPLLDGNKRKYFHVQCGKLVKENELNYDSDHEIDDLHELSSIQRLIDEYADVTDQEKEFMKLWNAHIMTFPPYGDRLLPVVCERFIARFKQTIIEQNLRYVFLLHLLKLYDFGLLYSEEILLYLNAIDYSYYQSLKKVSVASTSSSVNGGVVAGSQNSSSSSSSMVLS